MTNPVRKLSTNKLDKDGQRAEYMDRQMVGHLGAGRVSLHVYLCVVIHTEHSWPVLFLARLIFKESRATVKLLASL